MPNELEIVYTNRKYAESYNKAVDTVARERTFLATAEGFSLDISKNYINYLVENNYPQYFLISNDDVVGWCDITPKSIREFSHIGALGMGVLAEFRNQGHGRRLLLRSMEHARTVTKLEKIELDVFESNLNAIKMYRSVGFRVEGKRINARKLDGVYDNDIQMGLFLA